MWNRYHCFLLGFAVASSLFFGEGALIAQPPRDFSLHAVSRDEKGDEEPAFRSKEQLGKAVVLHFLLKTDCPYCMRYTRDFSAIAAEEDKTVHVFIKPDDEKTIREWIGQYMKSKPTDKAPTIYRDPEGKLAEQFDIPGGYFFHGQSVRYPATVILDESGTEIFRYVGNSNEDRLTKKAYAEAMSKIRKERAKK